MARSGLTHLDSKNRPTMVDVGAKEVTHRVAIAEARVRLPRAAALALRKSGHRTKKGPVFDTAIVAGVMAAKRTHELIPFCHPLGLDNCKVEIEDQRGGEIVIRCAVLDSSSHGRGDGGPDRRERRGAHDLRHVQGALARHRDHGYPAVGKDGREARLQAMNDKAAAP